MSLDWSALDWLARTSRQHLSQISIALIATLLAIYGQDINRWVRQRTRQYHFIVRTLFFVFLCAFGYGWFTVYAGPHMTSLFQRLPPRVLPAVIIAIFVLLGVLAERKRKI